MPRLYSLSLVRERRLDYDGPRTCLDRPETVAELLTPLAAPLAQEAFWVLPVDSKHRIVGVVMVSLGHENAALVTPRLVFKVALAADALALVVAHNHPSGDPTPSAEDRLLTKRLTAAGDVIGCALLDHVIIGDRGRFVSLARTGALS